MNRLGALLLCLLLLPCAATGQDLGRQHEALLAAQLAKIEKSRAGVPELYVLAAGMSSRQDVFKNDVETMRDLFDKHWNTATRSVVMIADESSKESAAYPTRANLRRAAQALGQMMDPQKDVFLLFLSSHGTRDGLQVTLPGTPAFTFSGVDVRRVLEASGARYRIVVLSACYSGALMNELADDYTMVMTAAHGTRSSFGCSFKHLHTWFTQALFESLAETPRFEQAFQGAARRIEEREAGGEAWEHSMPQIHVGSAVAAKLAAIEQRATRPTGWQPPVLATETGKVRQLLGDYVATHKIKSGETQVRWLQLLSVGTPGNGVYPISAWASHIYRNEGRFDASYDTRTQMLSGDSASLGEIRLSLEGEKFTGTTRAEPGAAPANVVFEKVSQRAIAELRAQHPPSKMRAKPSSVIKLVYLDAADCYECRNWERDHIQSGVLANMPEYKHVDFITAQRRTRKSPLTKGDLPESVAHLYSRFEGSKSYALALTRVPTFLLLVDDEIRVWKVGPFLDAPIYPVLRAAVREKSAGEAR